ncbi:MAG: sn-glycerol-1-phosphate dehydrogenase [Treponema sp.]|nr:sn-glycerol-1-phosphate dehydrogenase [Treponema sp.]
MIQYIMIHSTNKTGQGPLSLKECLAHADETKELILAKDALEAIPRLITEFFDHKTLCLIADENTYKAAGERVKAIAEEGGLKVGAVHIFPGGDHLHAEYEHIRFLTKWVSSLPDFPALVPLAVGAGTLNDLVKRTAEELDLPYLCVPTAASVDGYTPNGASLLMDGFKQNVLCKAPRVLAADLGIIAAAPAYLSSSGVGDLASKIIAGTDWIIAEKAGALGAPEAPAIDPIPWTMVHQGFREALEESVPAPRGDQDAIRVLFQTLAVTGFAMQYMKNSRPVSGAEHLWSHVWEMEDLRFKGAPVTHGFKVSIGTLAATAFTEIFFADPKGPPPQDPSYRRPSRDERRAQVSAAFKGSRAHDKIIEASMDKMMDEPLVETINEAFRDSWTAIRDRVMDLLIPYGELKDILGRALCPLVPEAIGLSRSQAIADCRRGQMIRNKYSIVDLAWDMGNFEGILKNIEDSNLYLR